MWVFLAGDAMSFGGLLAAYGALRYGSPNWPMPSHVLGIAMTGFMTFLLICSSVTMVKALAAVQDGDPKAHVHVSRPDHPRRHHLPGMQAFEWTHLIHEGLGLTQNPWGRARSSARRSS